MPSGANLGNAVLDRQAAAVPGPAVVLFTRDLRVHDHPALHAALAAADRVVPLFVLDDEILAGPAATPNRMRFLLDCLRDLRTSLVARGGSLVVRRGDVVDEVGQVCRQVGATSLHVSRDVSAYARRREQRLGSLADDLRLTLQTHPGVTVVEPGAITPSGGGVFQVFTAYWRHWREHRSRAVLPAPETVRLPSGLSTGRIPALEALVEGRPSPLLIAGGETEGRTRVDAWFDGPIADYERSRDDLAADATSRLSAFLHFGAVSALELADRCDLRRRGHDAFQRQLCWRDFNHQLLWGHPGLPQEDLRPRDDVWRRDGGQIAAWQEGRTGVPVVDAGMRQLQQEGFMHNRARLLAASFLTKHLYVDWRVGAAWFERWLVDADVANNRTQWQWTAGTGTASRPNRIFNPWAQSRRYNAADYIRRHVPELADLDDRAIHAPHEAAGLDDLDYPDPIVDHGAARARFLAARDSN